MTDEPLSVSLCNVWKFECRHDPVQMFIIAMDEMSIAYNSLIAVLAREYSATIDSLINTMDSIKASEGRKI